MSRRPLAQAGTVHALVYRDLNGNGVRDSGEPFEKGARITTGTVQAERATDDRGAVTIDQSSLADPMLAPGKALQVVVPRPGVPAEIEIALVGGGDIEGVVVKSGGLGFEGLDLELVDASGKTAGSARSDFDGFFLFERVAYGSYTLRLTKESAAAAKLWSELEPRIEVSAEKSVVRLGAIQVRSMPTVASAAMPSATP